MLEKLQLILLERLRLLFLISTVGAISPSLLSFLFTLRRDFLTRAIPLMMALPCPLLSRTSFVQRRRLRRSGGLLNLRALLQEPGLTTTMILSPLRLSLLSPLLLRRSHAPSLLGSLARLRLSNLSLILSAPSVLVAGSLPMRR